jgi:glycolate oxidase iron-sulfur subunit
MQLGHEQSELSTETVAAFAEFDTVIVNAAGCGSGMKDYGHLIGNEEFPVKVFDVHEFLAQVEPRAERHPLALRVAYHDACHLAHAQQIRTQPRALLESIPGLELLSPPEWELCCGSAGVYNLLEPDAAAELGRRKAANLTGTSPDVIVAANPGCVIQIAQHLERPLAVLHPIELLARSFRGER